MEEKRKKKNISNKELNKKVEEVKQIIISIRNDPKAMKEVKRLVVQ